MAKPRIKWNVQGFYELRSEPGVVADLEARAEAVAAAAGESGFHYETGSQQGAKKPQGRWRTSVVTADFDAILDNARHQTLLKALDAGRG